MLWGSVQGVGDSGWGLRCRRSRVNNRREHIHERFWSPAAPANDWDVPKP